MSKATDQPCRFCGSPVSQERVDIGYTHCMRADCVAAWRRERLEDSDLTLILAHKQGLMWVPKNEVSKNDMRRQGGR